MEPFPALREYSISMHQNEMNKLYQYKQKYKYAMLTAEERVITIK